MRILLARSKELKKPVLDAVVENLAAISGPLEFEKLTGYS